MPPGFNQRYLKKRSKEYEFKVSCSRQSQEYAGVYEREGMQQREVEMNDAEWNVLKSRFAGSAFRSKFRLGEKEMAYLKAKGPETIRGHAEDFVRKRLAQAFQINDGKQTPMRGHPVFIAQHATGTCCRGCLETWHAIPKGRELTADEIGYAVDAIMRWLVDQGGGQSGSDGPNRQQLSAGQAAAQVATAPAGRK